MGTLRAVVEYDGTAFCGLQFQPDQRSVAGVLEAALGELLHQDVKLTAAGRTDAGVHATGQVISFSTNAAFPFERLPIAMNSILPADVALREAALVPEDFSARFCARERTYIYLLLHDPAARPLLARYTHRVYGELSVEAMRAGACGLLGEHDFRSFCGVLPETGPTVRRVHEIALSESDGIIKVLVRGDGFLHRMVRIIVGTLVEMGAGRRDPGSSQAIIAAVDRRAAGYTAPPEGLYLAGVRYDDFDSFSEPRLARFP